MGLEASHLAFVLSPDQLTNLSRRQKQLLVMGLDVVLALLSTWIAFSLRIEGVHIPTGNQWIPYWQSPALMLPIFIYFGLYRAIFRYTDLFAIRQMLRAVGVLLLVYSLVTIVFWIEPNPRSMGVIQPLVLGVFVIASRLMARSWLLSSRIDPRLRLLRRRVLILGAGDTGIQLCQSLQNSPEYALVGFVDDDRQLVGRTLQGLKVFPLEKLAELVGELDVSDLVLAWTGDQNNRRQEIIRRCEGLQVHIQTARLTLGSGSSAVQELDVEDLLGRGRVPPSLDLLRRKNQGKVILVSGAGGSIGSELCRQLITTRPKGLVLVDNSEFNLYSIHQELQRLVAQQYETVTLTPYLADVRDARRMTEVLQAAQPTVFYHAAAYKHVPLVEQNPFEGVRNNFLGTRNCARLASQHGVTDFVLISTDKAVRPTNVMGATKRLAELSLQAFAADAEYAGRTTFSMVRFGNVLGSSGSVVPLFRQQIARGGPVTITHAEVTRFFMTIPEAAELVIQAGAIAQGGDVFVLDMGQPVKIMDLAKRMIKLAGYSVKDAVNPEGDIEIQVTGLRPGEKLYEELLIGNQPSPTEHPKIMRAREAHLTLPELDTEVEHIKDILDRKDVAALKQLLTRLVEGYAPERAG